MAKSSRSSAVKKNNQKLKKHVFGPVETARNERLSAKLLELASQPKPPRSEMEVERDPTANQETKVDHGAEDIDDMDVDEPNQANSQSNSAMKKKRAGKAARVEKKRHRKVKNSIVFPMRHLKAKKGKKR